MNTSRLIALPNKPLVSTRNGEAPLLAAQRRRWAFPMRTVRVLFALIACVGAPAQAKDSSCLQTLKPVHRPVPEYPSPEQAEPYLKVTSYLHVHVDGTITVEIIVSRDGTVSDARIVRSEYKLVGRNAPRYQVGYFHGFLEMNVLPTVKAWRFSPIPEPCTREFSFTWQLKQS